MALDTAAAFVVGVVVVDFDLDLGSDTGCSGFDLDSGLNFDWRGA